LSTTDVPIDGLVKTGVTIDFPQRHSRLTTLFRLILAIPLMIFGYVYEIVAFLATIIAWFSLVITARYPAGLYRFVAGYARFYTRFAAYLLLAVDTYPPFSGGEYLEYPVQVTIPVRKQKYSRLKALFRIIYIIPAYIVVLVLGIVLELLVFLAWFIIVISGRLPRFIENYMRFAFGWVLKFLALYLLLIENY
jgi:hypothetical protein